MITSFGSHLNVDLQQRGVEFTQLFGNYKHLRPPLLEKMPAMQISRISSQNGESGGSFDDNSPDVIENGIEMGGGGSGSHALIESNMNTMGDNTVSELPSISLSKYKDHSLLISLLQNILLDLLVSTDAGASDLAMATDLSNAVQKKNTRNANNDAPVSNNQDLLDLLDLDLSATAPTTSIMPGLQQLGTTTTTTTDHNLRGLDLNLGGFGSIGTLDAMSSSIPTNGNDLASMLGGLSAPVNPVLPVLPVLGGVGDMSSNLLGELSTTTTTNNVTVVRMT